jgi:SAM-dependent methyltransferase
VSEHSDLIRSEFERAAPGFAERTKGRFDDMGVVAFARLSDGARVGEVGAGTGNFLSLFEGAAAELYAIDITPEMLVQARDHYGSIRAVLADGAKLPFRSNSLDLVASAQMFHHIPQPVPILKEMARVCAPEGHILVVDQIARENLEEASAMNELDLIRDPSHAMSRPPSAIRILAQAAGLRIVDEKLWEGTNKLSSWMWPGEFPEDRIAAVNKFIEERGHETGMDWRPDGDDWVFTRRRIMLLASPAK